MSSRQIKTYNFGTISIFQRRLVLAAIAAPLIFASGVTRADVLEEVIVTAQKREQSLQDVGIAVSAFTGDQLSSLGVIESFDIAAFSPGVHISGNLAGQNTQFTIRGVTQNDFNDIVEAPNAVYLDDGYLAIAQAQTFAVFDIDRVEILKGPQGTLFGRNATGGLVHYISRKPNLEKVEGYADFTYGQFDTDADADQIRIEAAVGGPLTSQIAGRVALMFNKHDGYLENLYPLDEFGAAAVGAGTSNSPGAGAGADLGDNDTQAFRGSLLFAFNDAMSLNLSVNYAESEVATGPYQSKATVGVLDAGGELIDVIDTGPEETRATIAADGSDGGSDQGNGGTLGPPFGRPVPGGDFFGYIDPDGDDFTTSGDFAFEDNGETETTGFTAKYEWEVSDGLTFTSITDYKDYEKLLFIDVDSAPVNQLANYAGVDANSFTQELRVNGETESTRWVAGFYYLNIDSESDNGLKAPLNSLPVVFGGFPPAGANGVDIGVDAELQTDSYSLFGQLESDLSQQLRFIAGLRVIQEEKDFDMNQTFYASTGNDSVHNGEVLFPGRPAPFKDDSSDTLWAGKLQLDWRPNNELLLYAGINRGVKAGSFNAPIPGGLPFPDTTLPYDEEVLTSFEAGFKATLLGGTTRLNGSVFYYDYKDYQAFLFTGVSGVVVNADAENQGIELELQTSPIDGLDILLNFAWFDATVKDVPFRIGSPLAPQDRDPTYAPELQAMGLVRYAWSALGGTVAVQGDVSYSDEYFYNLRNFDADKFDSYVMVNAQVSWQSADENWTTTLAVRNVTDERAGIQGFDLATLCGCNEVSYRAPRAYSIGLRRDF
ncbi:MAG: TonB-dependent receptor [Pseudomonadales bacterium]